MKTSKPIKRFLDLLFPPICIGCGEILLGKDRAMCPTCEAAWEIEKRKRCSACGREQPFCICRITLPESERGNRAFAPIGAEGIAQIHLASYHPGRRGVSERVVLDAKDRALLLRRQWLGRELAERLVTIRKENEQPILTFVPRKGQSKRRSGTDQAQEMARGIGEAMGMRVYRILSRRGGADQKKKDAKRRFAEPFSYYTIRKRQKNQIKDRDVWLCDDVWTTGASLLICAAKLMQAGARSVTAITLCHTADTRRTEES